ncbi:NAD-dependent epimerase/dehydratase family protein [uncultured Vibrio sp.]|uniref:NAD-dependent epimerase/dehydratase family protein n=1 Tax=uncultured Vibrio sp. TaxID=114054 RepID=UPI00091C069F|nr:NAD-dependent epimerase/dehydratase family protein [uncultured Vibrio sp.]OIQ25088.1 MAG: hypothetical protein BM561_07305 [Vibrio sp. MedPE-SWchi]
MARKDQVSYFIVGAKGRLGAALRCEFSKESIVSLDRNVYANWINDNGADRVSNYFNNIGVKPTVFVASGLLNPSISGLDLFNVNYRLPANIAEGVTRIGGNVLTFGTVMERVSNKSNPYIESKRDLNRYIQSMTNNNVTHIQLHTMYGIGSPSPFMFLGQMLESIKNNEVFKMTSGEQLREYHHFMDDVKAIRKIIECEVNGVIDISHGNPISLKELAEYVFSFFHKSKMLEVGGLPHSESENYNMKFEKPPVLYDVNFRETLESVSKYLLRCH